ncbi:MAG: hypothetical protein ACTSWY_02745 [Promethearchaeota archaeon]
MEFLVLSIIGCIGLVFRLWLCEVYLKEELSFKKNYLSRTISYLVLIGWIYGLQNMTFNLLWASVTPVLWVGFFLWDMRFYRQILAKNNKELHPEWQEKKAWLLIERITLHPPIIILGLIPFFSGDLKGFILGNVALNDLGAQIMAVIYVNILIYAAFILLDKRATDSSKTGKIIWTYQSICTVVTTILVFLP